MYRILSKENKHGTWILRPRVSVDTPIADIDWFNSNDKERNAIEALMSAAPDMYNALQLALYELKHFYLHSSAEEASIVGQIEAALAKADGVKTETI